MRVADVETRELPRVSAREAVVLTRAARAVAAHAERFEARLGALGVVVLAFDGVSALAPAPSGEEAGHVVLGLARADGAGRLVIDGAFGRRVLAAALGVEAPPIAPLARLGLAERGVVAGVAASLLHAASAPFSVALVAPDAAAVASEGGVALALSVAIDGAAGWARLEIPSRWLAAAPAARGKFAALDVEARVELARTRLPAGALAGVVAGDAVVFDGEPSWAPASDVGRPVRLVVGAHAAGARLAADGRVTLEGALRPAPATTRGWLASRDGLAPRDGLDGRMPEEDIMDSQSGGERSDAAGGTDATAVLAAAPIEVVAELGRIVLRGEEVAGLAPGAVLAFGRVGASPVALRVGGEIWAEGELCDVDGELGVRVTIARGGR
jgi:flagellar motor switch/type III secretory pathway protein FliN